MTPLAPRAPHAPRAALAAASAALLVTVAACAPGAAAQAVTPNAGHDTAPLARCTVAASHDQPLVTEWPASYKARLEAVLLEGAVAVEYSGCELRIVDTCRIPGAYTWKKTTLSTDTTDIQDEDDLYAKLPLGALTLSGQLKTSGSLHVMTSVSGQMQLVSRPGDDATRGAECQKATHLVTALSIGAFKLVAGGAASATVGAESGALGVHGTGAQKKAVLRSAGDPEGCARATQAEPNADCRSPIQIFLTPIRRSVPLNTLSPLPDEKG